MEAAYVGRFEEFRAKEAERMAVLEKELATKQEAAQTESQSLAAEARESKEEAAAMQKSLADL